MIKRLLVPLDGSHLSEAALTSAGELAEGLRATMILARVVPPPVPGRFYASHLLDELQEAQVREAGAYLDQIAEQLRQDRQEVDTHVLTGHVAATLVEFALRERCDLIVMSSHGLGGRAGMSSAAWRRKCLSRPRRRFLLCGRRPPRGNEEKSRRRSKRIRRCPSHWRTVKKIGKFGLKIKRSGRRIS